jgi:hypothetical protein
VPAFEQQRQLSERRRPLPLPDREAEVTSEKARKRGPKDPNPLQRTRRAVDGYAVAGRAAGKAQTRRTYTSKVGQYVA